MSTDETTAEPPTSSEPSSPSTAPSSAPPPRPKVVRRSSPPAVYAIVLVAVLVIAGVGAAYEFHVDGWGKSTSTPAGACSAGVTLDGEGAAFVGSLVTAWGAAYASAKGNNVNYNPAGSGAGVTGLTNQLEDFAATDEPFNTTQTNALPGPILTLPITGGALTVIYNIPGLTGGSDALRLSGPVLADIYDGKITTWNDPRIQSNNTITLPSDPISVVYRTDAAGLTYVLTTLLSQDSTTWQAQHGVTLSMPVPATSTKLGASGNSKMLSDVATTSYTIGYSDLSDTLTQQSSTPSLQYASVLNPAENYVLPSEETAATAIEHISANLTFPEATGNWINVNMVNAGGVHDYPLSTLAYFFVYAGESSSVGYQPSDARDQVIRQWVSWVVADGQSLAATYDFVPLSSQLVSIDQTGLSGMTFSGAPLQACT